MRRLKLIVKAPTMVRMQKFMLCGLIAFAAAISLTVDNPAMGADTEIITHCDFVSPTYQAVWRPGTTEETLLVEASWDEFLAKDQDLRPQGWRLHQIHTNVYNCKGRIRWTFDVLWRLEGNIDEFGIFAWKWNDFINKNNEMRSQGWLMTLIDGFVSGNDTLFNAVWRRSTVDQIDIYGWSFNDFDNKTRELSSQGWRFHLIDSYQLSDGSRRYNASWRRGSVGEYWILGWAPQDYENQYVELQSQGWNLAGLTASGSGTDMRFDAFWHDTRVQEIRQKNMDRNAFLQAQKDNLSWGWNIYLFERD